jgi:hypothetical protein
MSVTYLATGHLASGSVVPTLFASECGRVQQAVAYYQPIPIDLNSSELNDCALKVTNT